MATPGGTTSRSNGRAPSTHPRPTLAICGGGNAGHALAVVASQHFDGDINWLVRSEETARLIRESLSRDGLQSTGAIRERATRLRVVSTDAADVIPDADIVMIVAPAFAHADVLSQIAHCLKSSALIGCLPARSGFEFEACRLLSGIAPHGERRIFGLQTLPWSARVVEKGRVVNFGAIKAKVLMAVLSGGHAPEIAARVSALLGIEIIPTTTFLDMTLGNPGQFIHPGLMYSHFGAWHGATFDSDSVPLFYAHATDEAGTHVERMSDETIAVARSIEAQSLGQLDLSGTLGIHDWLRLSYPSQTADTSTVATCFRTGPLQMRRAPTVEKTPGKLVPDFSYRYLTEDVPYGLVVTRAIAELAEVPTPAIDEVITWAQSRIGTPYLVDGMLDVNATWDLPIPQNYGCHTLEDLIRWHAMRSREVYDRSPVVL